MVSYAVGFFCNKTKIELIGANMKRLTKYAVILSLAGLMMTGCEKNAGNYYKEGMEAFQNRDYKSAEEYFSKAIEKNQEKAEYYISYGLALMKNEKFEEALKQLEKAILEKENQIVLENNKAAYRGLGIVYYSLQEYDLAIQNFEKALDIKELSSLDRDITCYLMECEEIRGNYEKAEEYCKKVLSSGESASMLIRLAGLEKKNEKFEEALAHYDQAIAMEKENYNYYFHKYYLLKEQGKKEEAQKVLERAASIKPKTDGQTYGQAKLYYLLGKTKAAQEGFETALEKGYAEAGFYLGQMAQKKGMIEKAVEYYVNYIESGKKITSAAVYNQLGICYLEQGNYEYARDTFTIGLKLNDPSLRKDLQFNQIIAYEHLGKFEKALENADIYLEEYPNDTRIKEERKFIKTRISKQ